MTFNRRMPFTGMALNRANEKRKSKPWFEQQLMAENTIFIIAHQGKYLFNDKALAHWSAKDISHYKMHATFILLGLDNSQAIIIADFSALSEDDFFEITTLTKRENAYFLDFRPSIMLLDKKMAVNLAYGRSLTHWHTAYKFCGYCGHATASKESGHMRQCTNNNCEKMHFPRTDPVVIMLVEYQPKEGPALCLLANHTRSPDNLVSTLAGFVDPGESLEEAVIREVKEEVGLKVDTLAYIASQPWPFPNSLMMGFYVKVSEKQLTLTDDEIASANWYSAEQVRLLDDWGSEGDNTQIPGKESIARYLIDYWLAQKTN